jgi:hypothetical protein
MDLRSCSSIIPKGENDDLTSCCSNERRAIFFFVRGAMLLFIQRMKDIYEYEKETFSLWRPPFVILTLILCGMDSS